MTTTQLPSPQEVAGPGAAGSGPRRRRRRSDRAPAGRSHRPLRWLAAGVVVVGAGYWVGWHSSVTTVEELEVVAPKGLSPKEIRAASGISQADHVPAVDGQAVELAIMTQVPAVAGVQVQRHLPHRVTLLVRAREPLAALTASSGFILIDAQGVPYDRVNRAKGLPLVSAGTDEGRAAAVAVLNSLPGDLRTKVAIVRASTRDDVALTMRDSAKVRWGSASDAELKARVLAALIAVKAKEYDVSAPLLPTTLGSLASPSPAP